tara:strand:+ start:642 stop:1235 length:594 start_codon:yes stop_codon:yes gene_type:complete
MLINTNLSYKNEINRKKFHLLSFALPLFYILNSDNIIYFSLLVLSSIVVIDVLRISNIYEIRQLKNVIRPYERNAPMTATYLIVTSVFIILLFDKNIAIYSLVVASVSDSAAAIYGITKGEVKLMNNKSLEGSFAFILSGMIFIMLIYFIIDAKSSVYIPLASVIAAGFIEHVTPGKYDNITTPLSYALFANICILL